MTLDSIPPTRLPPGVAHSPLEEIEPRLRTLLPAALYASAWMDPSPAMLMKIFQHLRTLHRILRDYVPRNVSEFPPHPGTIRHGWQEGTLMFTDLAGFTRMMDANASYGSAGAEVLHSVLNAYFAEMIEIVSKAGGDLLEFTGDALLTQFPADQTGTDTARAVRAGLRMQRAMAHYASVPTPGGAFPLRMRIGIHRGRFLTADIGTPIRMEHVLLGRAVQIAKQAESASPIGGVCMTQAACKRVECDFRSKVIDAEHVLVADDLTDAQLGEYDVVPINRRAATPVLMDRSVQAMLSEIETAVRVIEPLASYLPTPILNLVVESAARRKIPPDFGAPTVIFVNLIGLTESLELAASGEETGIISSFSRTVSSMNAEVQARGGVLKKVTCHQTGSDMVIYFGVPSAHTNDALRAATVALALLDIVVHLSPPMVGGQPSPVWCQIGMTRGPAFAAEIGEPHGRREFNVLGDTVNTASRVMRCAGQNQVLMTEAVHNEIAGRFACESLGTVSLKGKPAPVPIFSLTGHIG